MITADIEGNCGNQLIRIAIVRSVAENLGYEWGFNPIPSHDYFGGKSQLDFMNMDYGQEHDTKWGELPRGIKNIWKEQSIIKFDYGGEYEYFPFQKDIFNIGDNTKIVIRCGEDFRYYRNKKDNIKNWFSIRQEKIDEYLYTLKNLRLNLDENLCIVNARGGEYLGVKTFILGHDYWYSGILLMKEKNPDMKFICITDDVNFYKQIFHFPVIHISIGFDYWIINNAKNLLLSNSSFARFPAWLNSNSPFVIAPKYWARHNCSMGDWGWSEAYMDGWNYLDRDKRLFSYEEVVNEQKEKGIIV